MLKFILGILISISSLFLPMLLYSQELSHPKMGEKANFGENKEIELVEKIASFRTSASRSSDSDIASPKSVNIHPSGKKFYINSLEGGKTVVYSLPELEKIAVIKHQFSSEDSTLWNKPSGLFNFRHYTDNLNNFTGKPVEGAFSHGGKYFWVPYYRRSYDLNAQDPSAVAIIDTETNRIVRMMEAGVLPKMIACSPDGDKMAISHWGDNTVGLIDISSSDPTQWHYIANIPVGKQLFHDFSLTIPVNRDSNTGEALRGTVFTPDSRFLLVGCMSGGGIAVIDVEKRKFLGKITGMMPNLRHLVIKNGYLYLSINSLGYVQRIELDKILSTIKDMDATPGNKNLSGWKSTKVGAGARTLELSPKGDFIFVACNFASKLCVVDSAMNLVAELPADSYPVGLDVSPDGKWVITTSQGRKDKGGGNCVDIFSLKGLETEIFNPRDEEADTAIVLISNNDVDVKEFKQEKNQKWYIGGVIVIILLGVFIILRNKKKGR